MKRKIFTLIELLIRKICKKNITQRISLNLNSEFCPDENVFQDLAERVPHHDFAKEDGINPFAFLLSSSFDCSNVFLFDCSIVSPFLLPSVFPVRYSYFAG